MIADRLYRVKLVKKGNHWIAIGLTAFTLGLGLTTIAAGGGLFFCGFGPHGGPIFPTDLRKLTISWLAIGRRFQKDIKTVDYRMKLAT